MFERCIDRALRRVRRLDQRQPKFNGEVRLHPCNGIFGGPGRCVREERRVERIELVLEVQRIVPAPSRVAFWKSLQSLGATLAVTEMQPTPPIALKPSAMSSFPESCTNASPHSSRCADTRPRFPVASLTALIFGCFATAARDSTDM